MNTILYHPITRCCIGALGLAIVAVYAFALGLHLERARAAGRVAGVAIELGADIDTLDGPELAHYLNGINAAHGTCDAVTDARYMGQGVRIACDNGTHVYFLRGVNGVLFVTDISESGQ